MRADLIKYFLGMGYTRALAEKSADAEMNRQKKQVIC